MVMPCNECPDGTAIYQCPKCNHRTCSMSCCQRHKQRTGCNGKRNRTPFQRLEEMNDTTLRNDYFFLEDVIRTVDGGKRLLPKVGPIQSDGTPLTLLSQIEYSCHEKSNHHHALEDDTTTTTTSNHHPSSNKRFKPNSDRLPPRWRRLVHEANRRNITLLLMPQGMTRHKMNTSYYRHQTDTLVWKLEFVWHVVEILQDCKERHDHHDCNLDTTKGLSSTTTTTTTKFRTLTWDHHHVTEDSILMDEWNNSSKKKKTIQLEKHNWSQDENETLHFLIKLLPCPANQPRYSELRPDASIKEILCHRTIIEFPTIDVVPESLLYRFSTTIHQS
jgi:hypothetical protein